MMASSLQEQFHMIQEQQKRRFKQRAVSNNSKEDPVIPNKEHHNDLELKTTLQLQTSKTSSTEVSEARQVDSNDNDIQFLRSQIQKIQLENAQLRSSLKQAESKLIEVNHLREEERRAIGGTTTSVTQRIVELSKKNRELSAEVTSERNNVRQLRRKLKEYQNQEVEVKRVKNSAQTLAKDDEAASSENLQSVVEQLTEQLHSSNQKRAEYRNECQVLKQELKLSHRVISKEIGEEVNIPVLLKTGSGWRGRSQQIIALQNKVSELQQQLERVSTRKKYAGELDSTPTHVNTDSRQVTALKKIEDTKKKSLEVSQSELASLQVEHSRLQQQCSALKSRNKILTAELKSLKTQSAEKLKPLKEAQTQPSDKRDLEERLVLEQRNQRLQTQLSKCLSELQSFRQAPRNKLSKPMSPTTRQPRSAPLPPIIPPSHSRGSTHSLSRKTASAGKSLLGTKPMPGDTLAQVSDIERDRLMELTLSLQQRLDSSNDKLTHTENELLIAQQRNAKLSGRSIAGTRDKSQPRSTSKEAGRTLSVGELEERLEIEKNENEVLKETLELTRQEKLSDMKLLQDMMKETKQLFVHSVRQLCTHQ